MNVTIRENQSIPVIDIQGEITMYDIEPISEAIGKLIQEKKYRLHSRVSRSRARHIRNDHD